MSIGKINFSNHAKELSNKCRANLQVCFKICGPKGPPYDFFESFTPLYDKSALISNLFAGGASKKEESGCPNYDDAGLAVEAIIDEYALNNDALPQIIAFGELHDRVSQYGYSSKGTSLLFANEIIPSLKKMGYEDLVAEFLIAKGESEIDVLVYNEIQEEIKRLNPEKDTELYCQEFKDNYPLLFNMLDIMSDPENCLRVICAAKKHGINLHGGCFTYTQLCEVEQRRENADPIPKRVQAIWINDNSYKAIDNLVKEGKKVISYNGMTHNNIDDIDPEKSFGDDFIRNKISYLEIDMIVPQIASRPEFKNTFISIYLGLSPETGVNVYPETEEKKVIIFSGSLSKKIAKKDADKLIKIYKYGKKFLKAFLDNFKIKEDELIMEVIYPANLNKEVYVISVSVSCGIPDEEMQKFAAKFEAKNKEAKISVEKTITSEETRKKNYYFKVSF